MLYLPRGWTLDKRLPLVLYGSKGNRGRTVGKRQPLKEVSTLGQEDIDVDEIDLSQLLGGDAFTLSCTITH